MPAHLGVLLQRKHEADPSRSDAEHVLDSETGKRGRVIDPEGSAREQALSALASSSDEPLESSEAEKVLEEPGNSQTKAKYFEQLHRQQNV